MRTVSGLAASAEEVLGKGRQQDGHSSFVSQGVRQAVSKLPFITPVNLPLLFTDLVF